MQYKPTKGRSDDGGLAASSVIKLAKDGEEEKRICAVGIAYLPL